MFTPAKKTPPKPRGPQSRTPDDDDIRPIEWGFVSNVNAETTAPCEDYHLVPRGTAVQVIAYSARGDDPEAYAYVRFVDGAQAVMVERRMVNMHVRHLSKRKINRADPPLGDAKITRNGKRQHQIRKDEALHYCVNCGLAPARNGACGC